jgi:hypothetical protein
MLHARSLPSKLWVEALNYASYIQNKAPRIYVEDRRIGHLLRLGHVINQMSHTSASLDLEHGPIFLFKRGKSYIHRAHLASLWDIQMM